MKKSKKNAAAVKAVGKKRNVWQNIIRYRVLILMCLPAILFFLAFNYIPLPGIYVALITIIVEVFLVVLLLDWTISSSCRHRVNYLN